MNPAAALLADIVGVSEQTARRNEWITLNNQEMVNVTGIR
jgi:hypothetical protein